MAKQTEFEAPPEGHVGLLVYDIVTNKWYAVLGDDDGHIQLDVSSVALPDGAATSLKQLPDGHNVAVSNMISGFATALKQLPDGHAVTVDNADIEVVQPTAADLKMSQHQYDGSTWRKSNLLFGYYDRWAFSSYDDASGTGDAEVLSDVVDEGYIHIVQSVAAHQDSGAPKQLTIYLYAGATSVAVYDDLAAISGKYHSVFIDAVLKEGDYVKAVLVTPGDGKRLRFRVWGYKMKVDM